ncbi:NAD(P)H-dependent oxidoreductase [Fusobacterium ulcerans]|uniref:NAD(P)H-dependent oxidoreductase n=1 Tax=Fusobacterium ulcerans TaxID=861 RepID=UPI00241DB83B|nr:NAD(P)H-dependent oxidoreductase [Fusobacterium ulcerans]MEE0138093.1 NAD(P)H-dependent oxidoreductase [Fusobacterium ulcerans]
MKILGISAGTRNGNNDSMCKEALMGAKEMGAEIEFIRLLDLDIKYCTGCIACVKSLMSGKGGQCVLKDDFEWLRDKMMEADGIIFSVPIFEKGAAAIFRSLTDRFGPRMDRGNNLAATEIAKQTNDKAPDQRVFKEKVISYIGLGGSDWTTRIQCDFEMLSLIPIWKTINNEVFSWSKNVIMEDEKVTRIHQIGINLAKAAADIENAQYLGDKGVCPHCHSRNFYLNDDSTKAVCCLCGIVGEVKIKDGKVKFEFPQEQLEHAHNTMPGKFIHMNDIKNNEGALIETKKTEAYRERLNKYKEFIQPSSPKI